MDMSLHSGRSTGITGRVSCVGSPSTVSSHFRVSGAIAGCLTITKWHGQSKPAFRARTLNSVQVFRPSVATVMVSLIGKFSITYVVKCGTSHPSSTVTSSLFNVIPVQSCESCIHATTIPLLQVTGAILVCRFACWFIYRFCSVVRDVTQPLQNVPDCCFDEIIHDVSELSGAHSAV